MCSSLELFSQENIINVTAKNQFRIGLASFFSFGHIERLQTYETDAYAARLVPAEDLIAALTFTTQEKPEAQTPTIFRRLGISLTPTLHARIARLKDQNKISQNIWTDRSAHAWWK